MATLTADRAADAFPVFKSTGAGILCAAYGSYDLAADPADGDVVELCKLPAGAVILGGYLRAEDIDTNGTETLDIDVGTSADADAYGNFGVLVGDAVAGYLPEGGNLLPLNGTLGNGPVTLTAETVVQATINTGPATFAAGTITVVVHYVCP